MPSRQVGWKVELFEKNEQLGGVASQFQAEGFTFDMGPSWYLMPDVFENFFTLLGEKVEDHLDLVKLGPSYKIFFKGKNRAVSLYSDLERDIPTLEEIEPGCGEALRDYLERSKFQYEIALEGFVYKNYDTVFDFFNKQTMIQGQKLQVFAKMNEYVEKFFHTDELQKIMEYQLVFLGSSPYDTPALYNIMSHIDFNMGVYYPQGGIHEIPNALARIAEKHGATMHTSSPVEKILTEKGRTVGVRLADGTEKRAAKVIVNANIRHAESMLEPAERQFSESYWESRTLAPSAFILYLGVEGRIPTLTHHNLIFSEDWRKNFGEIFDKPAVAERPVAVCLRAVRHRPDRRAGGLREPLRAGADGAGNDRHRGTAPGLRREDPGNDGDRDGNSEPPRADQVPAHLLGEGLHRALQQLQGNGPRPRPHDEPDGDSAPEQHEQKGQRPVFRRERIRIRASACRSA